MSKTINDGGPAFPIPAHADDLQSRIYMTQQGMSLRDWFAGQYQLNKDYDSDTIQGWSMKAIREAFGIEKPEPGDALAWLRMEAEIEARLKYIHADAMIKQKEL